MAEESGALEHPSHADALYHARGAEVSVARPVLTGDVLKEITIPGLDDGPGFAVIVTHPCSMRRNGVDLVDRTFVARVRKHVAVPPEQWATGHMKVMPLPALGPETTDPAAAFFADTGLISAEAVEAAERVASLSEVGINLLQQRLVFYLTRFVVPTFRLHESCAAVFREIELHEEWVEEAANRGEVQPVAAAAFHEWIRQPDKEGELTRQDRLHDAQQVAAVRRAMRVRVQQDAHEMG